MKKILLLFFGLLCLQTSFSQSDNCSSATVITPNATCVYTNGTSVGATQSIPGCVGIADDDVWYQFTAAQTSHQITVTPSVSYDPVVQLFSGGCSVLVSMYCQDLTNAGQPEVINATGLTIGTVYIFRIYHYFAGSASSTFSVCISNPPTPPANDACTAATLLSVNSSCITTAGTSYGATQSYTSACNGSPDDDVWYKFVANNSQQVISVMPSSNMDAVIEIMSGTCGSLTSIDCIDNSGTGGTESVTEVGLIPGTTYYVRVFDYWSGNGGFPFSICVSGTSTTGDEPCSAFVLPPVTSDCSYITLTNAGATASTATAPTPSACGGSGAMIGGFSSSSHDMWFAVVVPASGNIYITSEPNITPGRISDGVMALYSGACGSLTQIACNDDHNYPGTGNDYLPYLSATGLTPGATVYIRYWGYGSSTGYFGLCVSSPTNDACSTALYICDLNGYSANTNAYTPDRPCNMRGDAEVGAGYVYTPGSTPSGGSFGLGGTWGVGQPYPVPPNTYSFDVTIDNNSWIKFTAAAASATFSVTIGNCFSNGGIQMQIFSGIGCCGFTPVSDFQQSATSFALTANSLTVGQDYFLMVDGWGGDICNYTVTANSGVQFTNITAAPSTICFGDSTKLTGPAGASSYLWSPGGQTTQVITVAPPTNMTYSCIVSGVCGSKQTLSKAITVNPLPITQINGALTQTLNICANTTTTLTASGGSTYSWSPAAGLSASTGAVVTVTPTATTNTTYTVTGTNASGCKNVATISIKGLALPTFSVSSNHPSTCFNQKDTLIAVPSPAGTYTYSWSNGATTASITPVITANTVLTVTITNINNCKSIISSSVNVLSLPTINTNTASVCNGQTATLTGNGGTSYTWTPAATLSSGGISTTSVSANPTTTTNYTISGTGANTCIGVNTTTVVVNPLPTVTVNSATVCNGTNTTLTANGATTYSWSTSQSGNSISVTPSSTTSYTVTGTNGSGCKNTAVATVSVNPVPTINTVPTISSSYCSASTGSITGIGITGVGALSYTWTNGMNAVVGNTQNINNQPAGTYNVFVTDANCSATFGPYSITNPGSPAAPTITSNTTTVCIGKPINVNATSGAFSPTYNWSGPSSFTTTSPSFTLNPTLVNESGVYAVTVTSAGCTSTAATITLTINNLPLVNATSTSNPYCAGATVGLNGSTATSYTWTGVGGYISNQQNPQITNSTTLTTGIYTLTATDANGCINTDTAKVIVNITPVLSTVSANTNTLCAGQTLQLNSTVNPATAAILWTGPNSFSSTSANPPITNITTAGSGTYSVTATVGNCSSATNTVSVLVNPTAIATASVSSGLACTGSTITLSGSGGTSYTWSGPNSYSSNQQNNTLNNVNGTSTGIYTLTASNIYSCSTTATVSLVVAPSPTITLVSTNSATNVFCAGNTLILNAVVNPSTAPLQWTGPNGFASPPLTTTITNVQVNQSGTYSVTANVGTCTSNMSLITITVNPIPIATAVASNTVICTGNTITLVGGTVATGNTYNWSGPAGYTSQNATNTISPNTSGTNTYTLIVTNTFNCKDTATTLPVTVNITPNPAITANAQTCTGGTLTLSAAGNGTINWYSDAALTNLVNTGSTFNPPTASGTTNIYYVSVTSSNGCTSATSTSVSAGNYNIQVAAIANTYNGNAPLSVVFSGTVTGSSNPTYSWTLSDNATSTIQNPSHTYNNGGDYAVVLTGIDLTSMCSDTAMLTVHVIDQMIVIIPNIFTPNGDGINDEFFLTMHGVKSIEGFIMNRWGQMMYTWNELNSIWDGKAPNGNSEVDGVYFYVIKATPFKGEMQAFKGTLTISR